MSLENINEAINENRLLEYIKSEENNVDFSKEVYFIPETKEHLPLLLYLIEKHDLDCGIDTSAAIAYLVDKNKKMLNFGEPLHYLLKKKKLRLLSLFIEEETEQFKKGLKITSKDKEGQTLIARLIEADYDKDKKYKDILLNKYIAQFHKRAILDPYIYNDKKGLRLSVVPFQHAILTNNYEIVKVLLQKGASIDTPCGVFADNAFFLAARYSKVNALETLISDKPDVDLNAKNSASESLIDLLCHNLEKGENISPSLYGIAILLCHKADVPENPVYQNLLTKHRIDLLKSVALYTQKTAQLAANFVRACHCKGSALHNIIYARNSFSEAFFRFFGVINQEAQFVEKLVWDHQEARDSRKNKIFSEAELNFTEFVWKYHDKLTKEFYNPWSTMLLYLASGQCTSIKEIEEYKSAHPNTRTAEILREKEKTAVAIHRTI